METGARHERTRDNASRTFHKTDWLALEEQLNRTRTILHDILTHLQGVLKNLRTAKEACRGFASKDKAGAFKNPFRGAQARAGTCNGRPFGTGSKFQSSRADKTFQSQDRFRNRPQGGFGAKAKPGPFRTAEDPRAESRKTDFKSSFSKTFTGSKTQAEDRTNFSRERPRFDFGAKAGAGSSFFRDQAGKNARPGFTSQGAAGTSSTAGAARGDGKAREEAGHRVNRERQERGRIAARRGEMNLKSAYDILCLDYPCDAAAIKSAYRTMARMYHPDLGGDEEMMKDVNLAYELAMRFCSGPRRPSSAWAV